MIFHCKKRFEISVFRKRCDFSCLVCRYAFISPYFIPSLVTSSFYLCLFPNSIASRFKEHLLESCDPATRSDDGIRRALPKLVARCSLYLSHTFSVSLSLLTRATCLQRSSPSFCALDTREARSTDDSSIPSAHPRNFRSATSIPASFFQASESRFKSGERVIGLTSRC